MIIQLLGFNQDYEDETIMNRIDELQTEILRGKRWVYN